MRSWQSVVFEKFLLLRGSKKKFIDLKLMEEFIASKYSEKSYELDAKFQRDHRIVKSEIENMSYYIINEQPNPHKVIYYFHGGAYINEPLIFHWRYLVKLSEKTNFTIVVPIYPKLPRFTHEDAFQVLHALFSNLVIRYDAPFIFMGDSAGGGLALAFAQDVKIQGLKQPEQIVLHSPWLDVTGEHPKYQELQKIDPMLGLRGAQKLGKLWANSQDVKHYKVSPLHGELKDIGRITMFVGTSEMLLVDAHMLLQKANEQEVEILYFEYPKMNHVFPVFPIPEAKHAMNVLLPILMK
ncbi:MAG: alpha/beta hydrolase [Solibacillus sp.]|uniref:alpha/beta hydrolase n=1 Tax=Solibacillus sp. TaxID=1909654 RepID=UPI0033158E1F